MVDIEEDDRQGPVVPRRAVDLALEVVHQVALVVQAGQGIEDRQPVQLLVVIGLDIAAGQEAVQAVADPEVVAIGQRGLFRGRVVDEGPVGAFQVRGQITVDVQVEPRVAARDREIMDGDVTVIAATQDDRLLLQEVAGAHRQPGRVDMDQAGVLAGSREGPLRLDLLSHGLDSHGNPPPPAGRPIRPHLPGRPAERGHLSGPFTRVVAADALPCGMGAPSPPMSIPNESRDANRGRTRSARGPVGSGRIDTTPS